MGIMDQLRGYQRDLDESDVIADGRRCADHQAAARRDHGHVDAVRNRPIASEAQERGRLMARLQKSQDEAARRLSRPGGPAGPLFIHARPKGDGLVWVLLRQLTELNPDAGTAGRKWYEDNRENLTVDQGSEWINRIRAKIAEGAVTAPIGNVNEALNVTRKGNAWATWREVAAEVWSHGGPRGTRFAVPTDDGAINELAFWWITKGRGDDGRYFLRQVIGGQGAVRVRMTPEAMTAIARKAITIGVGEAMATFGREIGSCGACGTELTNDESRALGIGPECRRKGRG